jgi:hypothetical protein
MAPPRCPLLTATVLFSGSSLAAGTTARFPGHSITEAADDATPAPYGTICSVGKDYSSTITLISGRVWRSIT